MAALKKHESGISVKEVSKDYAISEVTFYNWKSKYGGKEASDVRRLKDLKEENSRLKRMFSELSMDHVILKDVITNKGWGPASKGNRRSPLSKITTFLLAGPVS